MRARAVFAAALLCATAARADDMAPRTVPSRAALAAELLANADAAATLDTPGGRGTLARTLAQLDRLGVQDRDDDHALREWRQHAGASAAPVLRGRVLGPAYRRGWLQPGAEMRIQQLFVGGEQAEIAVAAVPRDPARVTLSIEDAGARCAGASVQCRWLPLFTQRYTIVVRNHGAAVVRFYLVMD